MDSKSITLLRGCSIQQSKDLITETIQNIITNLKYLKSEQTHCELTINLIIQEADELIQWYSKVKSKIGMLDYLRDYQILDNKFSKLLKTLNTEIYIYNLCLIEGRFKIFKI